MTTAHLTETDCFAAFVGAPIPLLPAFESSGLGSMNFAHFQSKKGKRYSSWALLQRRQKRTEQNWNTFICIHNPNSKNTKTSFDYNLDIHICTICFYAIVIYQHVIEYLCAVIMNEYYNTLLYGANQRAYYKL